MYKIMMFEGGVYKFNELKELIEDIGGFILQESVMQTETMLHLAFPEEEERVIRDKIKDLGGKFKELPLAGAEIVIIDPSLGKHHAVDPVCDIAEFFRRKGAITNMLGLARGVGQRIAQMTAQERAIIEEFDAAVFVFGCFKECIEEKVRLCAMLDVPYMVVGGPPDLEVEHYVGGIGRKTDRMRRKGEIDILDDMTAELGKIVDERRREIEEDPLAASPLFIKDMIEMVIPPEAGEELPIIIQLDGLRINIEEKDVGRIKEVEVGKKKLSEICDLKKSLFKGYLLKIRTEAVTGSVF
ncbi:MAG TPA: methyl-coenzyme M reductase family protein [Candidatus Bathyarchaeia archaeon]|nr:methyl-coenzyme M reductase family protein [Candidatus Bathyarchaeia archaeon]